MPKFIQCSHCMMPVAETEFYKHNTICLAASEEFIEEGLGFQKRSYLSIFGLLKIKDAINGGRKCSNCGKHRWRLHRAGNGIYTCEQCGAKIIPVIGEPLEVGLAKIAKDIPPKKGYHTGIHSKREKLMWQYAEEKGEEENDRKNEV